MGQSLTHFSVCPLASVLQSSKEDIARIIDVYENDERIFDAEVYGLTLENLNVVMEKVMMHESDQEILRNFYCLIDKRGFQYASIMDILVSFSVMVAKDIQECLELSFFIYDRKSSNFIEKADIYRIFNILNETCYYCGDKKLPMDQVNDFVDSLYTATGRIDGPIYYPDYYAAIKQHPLVEMYCSLQFQGAWQDKYTDERLLVRSDLYR